MAYNVLITVDLPPEENRIVLSSGYVYFYTEMKYDPVTKRTKDNRKAVGKLSADDPLKMHPNQNYYSLVAEKNSSSLDQPPTDTVSSTNEEADLGDDESNYFLPKPMARHVNVGHYIGLFKAAERIGMITALQKAFPMHWEKIFALVTYVIDTSCSTAQLFPYWGYQNYCGFSKPFSDSTISEVYSFIGKDDWAIDRFIRDFNNNYQKSVPTDKERIVAFDATNRNTTCKENRYAQFGKPKVKKDGVPQVNTALMVDEKTGIPLYYENYFGSLLDKNETTISAERVKELGFEKLMFVMDSGYASKDCIDSIKELYEFSVMTPDSFDVVKYMMEKYAVTIKENTTYYLWSEDAYGIQEQEIAAFDGKYNAFLFYDSQRGKEEVDSIHDKARALLKTALERKRYTETFRKTYAPYILIETCQMNPVTKQNFTAKINTEAVAEEVRKAGYFVVISNSNLSPERILQITRGRDKGEKAFQRFKSSLDMSASGTHNTLTYDGKTFMAFCALIVSEAFRWYLKEILSARTSTTMETCLAELRNFQMQIKSNGKYMPLTAMTKVQKEIYIKLGMDWASVIKVIRTLNPGIV